MNFKGLYTAILTPFRENGKQIDFTHYRQLVERQIAAGVTGIVPCGTTGESPTLSHSEHRELIARSVEYAQGKLQVIAGTGSNSTQEAIELTQAASRDGADAVMLVNPYYNKPTQEGLLRHFQAIADNSQVPVMLYNIQSRTGVNIEVETMQELAKHERIQAVKEASGDPLQMIRIKKACNKQLSLLCGDDNITPAFMGLGGDGIVSVASNIYPKYMVQMLRYYQSYDFLAANQIFYELVDFMNALFWETNPIPVKTAAAIAKLCNSDLRLPLTEFPSAKKEKLRSIMEKIGRDK